MLVDSTIFIHYLRGKKQAREFLTNPPETLSTSVIVVMEIVAGLKKRDLTDSFFAFLQKQHQNTLYI
jgi:predicted nucleic acid-binding protein